MANDKVTDLVRLRQRFLDLQKLNALSPESFGTFQQAFMEVYQQAERNKQSCLAQAENFRRQASASESQAHAFSTISSILYSIVDGHIGIEQRRIAEDQNRKAQEDGTAPKMSASGAVYDDEEKTTIKSDPPPAEPTKKRGRAKGTKSK